MPFAPTAVSDGWFDWPALTDLFPTFFPGVKTDRDAFLIDIDLDRLRARIAAYFDPDLTHGEVARRYPAAMRNTTSVRLAAREVRNERLARRGPSESGIVRCAYRPFDNRWLYWEPTTGLLARPRPEYRPHVFEGNLWLSAAQHLRKGAAEAQTCFTEHVGQLHLIERSASLFPAWLRDDAFGQQAGGIKRSPNLSAAAQGYLDRLSANVEDLFHYVLAVQHDPAYRAANAGALRMEWPRIPLPGWPGNDVAAMLPEGAAGILCYSSAGSEAGSAARPGRARARRHGLSTTTGACRHCGTSHH